MNLYKSGIPLEVIAFQTDLEVQEVQNIVSLEELKHSEDKIYNSPSLAEFYLDAIVDIN